jgi:hypothetical protein
MKGTVRSDHKTAVIEYFRMKHIDPARIVSVTLRKDLDATQIAWMNHDGEYRVSFASAFELLGFHQEYPTG